MSKNLKQPSGKEWTFLTNHFHVVFVLYREPTIKISEIADEIGITYRAVQRILAELAAEKVLAISKDGRRNVYTINKDYRLRHPLESKHSIGELLDLMT